MWMYLAWENVHFAVYLLAALASLSGLWLYLDAWGLSFVPRKMMGLLGWGLLALSFFIGAANVELSQTLPLNIPRQVFTAMLPLVRTAGYLLLAASIWLQPIFKKPKVKGLVPETLQDKPQPKPEEKPVFDMKPLTAVWPLGITGPWITMLGPAITALLVASAYFRRATRGLERHVWHAVPVFTLLAGYEVVWLARLWRDSVNPTWYKLGAAFGSAWMIEHVILTAASIWLVIWVVRYLLRRLKTQLILAFTSVSLAIFLITTVTFSGFALRYLQNSAVSRLQTDAQALSYLLEVKTDELADFTQLIAQDQRWVEAIKQGNEGELATFAQEYLTNQQASELAVLDSSGIVLASGDNPEEKGTSWSDDPLVKAAQERRSSAGIWKQSGPLADQLSIRSTAPIMIDDQVFAIIWAGNTLDNAFVDGIKRSTGLDAAVLAGTQLSASSVTVVGEDGRWIGTDLGDDDLRATITEHRTEPVNKITNILNQQFLGSYLPLEDVNKDIAGFLWVGTTYDTIVKAVGEAVQLTFVVSVILIALSLLPSYVIASFISRQVR